MSYGGLKWTLPRNSGGIPYISSIFSPSMEVSKLTRDGTAETVSRDQIPRREREQRELFIFPVQLTTTRIGNHTRFILTLANCATIHTYHIEYVVRFFLPDGVFLTCDGGLDY